MTEPLIQMVLLALLVISAALALFRWRQLGRARINSAQTEQRIVDLTEHLGTAVFLVRQTSADSFTIAYANRATHALVELDLDQPADALARFVAQVHEEDRSRIVTAFKQARRSGDVFRESMRFTFADGRSGWLVVEAQARSEAGGDRVWSGSVFDLSSERQLNEALSHSIAANEQFLGTIGAALRSPVHAISEHLVVFARDGLAAEEQSMLDSMQKLAMQLATKTENLLDMSEMGARRLTLTPVRTDLQALIDALVAQGQQGCAEHGQSFEAVLEPDLPGQVKVDATRLRQLLRNLLFNAIRYTGPGQVRLRVARAARPTGRMHGASGTVSAHGPRVAGPHDWHAQVVWLAFTIEDTGPGIDHERLHTLFEPYSVTTTDWHRSAGLGLAISQRLATLMGGAISVETEPGQGSRFTVTVPVTHERKPGAQPLAAGLHGASGGRILYVEDDALTRLLMASMLRLEGYVVEEASSAQQALELINTRSYEAMVLDYRMPGMTGGELAVKVRAMFEPASCPRLIALTAGISESEWQATEDLFDTLLIKPVTIVQLVEAMQRDASPLQQGAD